MTEADELLCPDCGTELVDAAYATRDPGDDRLACECCGRVDYEEDWRLGDGWASW